MSRSAGQLLHRPTTTTYRTDYVATLPVTAITTTIIIIIIITINNNNNILISTDFTERLLLRCITIAIKTVIRAKAA